MLLQEDLQRFRAEAANQSLFLFFWRAIVDPGVWIDVIFRAESFLYKKRIPVIPWLLFMLNRIIFAAEIFPSAEIAGQLRIFHGSGLVIGSQAKVGRTATIYHGVTLGASLKSIKDGWPQIGNNCLLGAGCMVLGKINIGDNVKIGANAVVLNDVVSNSTVVGNPGRII